MEVKGIHITLQIAFFRQENKRTKSFIVRLIMDMRIFLQIIKLIFMFSNLLSKEYSNTYEKQIW